MKLWLSIILVYLVVFCSQAQSIVSKITFEGLERTRKEYLLQFLTTRIGQKLDSVSLETDRNRLVNLEIIAAASYRVELAKNGLEVVFTCEEFHTLVPVINFGGIRDNIWFRIGASDINVGGKGHKVSGFYQYNDRHTFRFDYQVPVITNSRWGYRIALLKWSTIEPLYFEEGTTNYDYDNNLGELAVHYNFTFHHSVEIGGGFFNEVYFKNSLNPEDAPGPDQAEKNKILGKLVLRSNFLRHHYYYLDGWHNQFNLETVETIGEQVPFYIAFNDFRFYHRLGKLGNLATRLRIGLSTNNDSPFAPFVLDSYFNIRGVGNRVDRGTGTMTLNLEYRHTILDAGNFAVQGVAFTDAGVWRNPGGDLKELLSTANLQVFAGPGFRIIHKKIANAILRVDYGVGLTGNNGGWVIGLNQYF